LPIDLFLNSTDTLIGSLNVFLKFKEIRVDLTSVLHDADTNNDELLSFDELYRLMSKSNKVNVVAYAPICKSAKKVMNECERGVGQRLNVSNTFDESDSNMVHLRCKNGYSSLDMFSGEHCILNSYNLTFGSPISDSWNKSESAKEKAILCSRVRDCMNQDIFHRSQYGVAVNDIKYYQKAIDVNQMIFFTGLMIAVVMFLVLLIDAIMAPVVAATLVVTGIIALLIGILGLVKMRDWRKKAQLVSPEYERIIKEGLDKAALPLSALENA
jgi:hypothetical protein